MRIALPTEAYDKNPRMGHVSVGCGRRERAGAGRRVRGPRAAVRGARVCG